MQQNHLNMILQADDLNLGHNIQSETFYNKSKLQVSSHAVNQIECPIINNKLLTLLWVRF